MPHEPELSPEQDELLALLLREQGYAPEEPSGISPRADAADAPLSAQQRRLWFLHQLDPAGDPYVIPAIVRVSGPLDVPRLQSAIQGLVRRHQSLRTVFVDQGGVPRQKVLPFEAAAVIVEDLGPVGAGDGSARVEARVAAITSEPFDLAAGPLLRATILRIDPEQHVVVLAMHHIVSDGWSMGVLVRDLIELYAAAVEARPSTLPPLPVQYADFAVWQDKWRASRAASAQLDFWTGRLRDVPPLDLPTDRQRPAVLTYGGGVVNGTIDAGRTAAVRHLGQACGTTVFMTLLTAWAALLHRYTGQHRLAIGTPSANRNRGELEPLIGFFINALVLRADVSGNPSFATLLERMKQESLDGWANQDLPFEEIVEALQPSRSLSRNPLFQVMFVLQNAPVGSLEVAGLRFDTVDLPSTTAKFDLTLYAVEIGETISLLLEYNSDLFDEATASAMLGRYQRLLDAAVSSPDCAVADLPLLSPAERERMLVDWNATSTPYPRDATIHALFRDQASRTPGVVAVRCGPVAATYGELDARSDLVAARLRARGVAPDEAVALVADRSIDTIVGMLGILKAGAGYLPIDPAWPTQRLTLLLAAAGVRLVLATAGAELPKAPGSCELLAIGRLAEQLGGDGPPALQDESSGAALDLAYVMFTSGSTGTPKGVAVPHRAVVRLVRDTGYVQFAGETLLQFAPQTFDASTFEIWGALLNGGTVALAPPGTLSLSELARALSDLDVTTAWLTAGLFHQMAEFEPASLGRLRQLVAGGDVLSVRHVNALRDAFPRLRLVNGFGPTETTTFALCHPLTERVPDGQSVAIGRPIANTRAYILDTRGEASPPGVAGELYIGGDALARGYVGRADLTAERFLPDPCSSEPGARMYRTGDRARWREDGTVEFLGRRDRQCKIRGFRIEAAEIESMLMQHAAVRSATVITREQEGTERELIAYLVADDTADTSPATVRAFLHERLPDYMVPSRFVRIAALPLTPNGKVDAAALPPPEETDEQAAFLPPRTPDEAAVARVWADVLRVPRVGVNDDFFTLGGHSLLATQVVARLRDEAGAEVSLRAFFDGPTVEALAREVGRVRSAGNLPGVAIPSLPRSTARRKIGRAALPS
jgi:amino acid adenylation domain-containing protein